VINRQTEEARSLLVGVADAYFGHKEDRSDWVQRKLKAHLWSGQRKVSESIKRNRYTVVPSSHGTGKSFFAAATACEWIDTHDVGDAFVVSTAPTSPQVTAILWRYIERMHRKGQLQGQINMGRIPEWKIGKQLVGYGRKPADYDEAGFQGIHELYPLIIIDEAAGIPSQLWVAIDALATNENARVLAIGNPDDANSTFAAMCMPGSGWNIIRLDGLKSPNFSEQEVKAVSGLANTGDLYTYMVENNVAFSEEKVPYELSQLLVSPLWVAERMIRWGVTRDVTGSWQTSPLWESRVRAQFPADMSGASVIPLAWVQAAVDRWRSWKEQGELTPTARVISCDVARFGEDETVICERSGYVVISLDRYAQQDTQTTALRIKRRMEVRSASLAIVDVIGIGGGVVDRLREEQVDVASYNASASTDMMDTMGEFSFPNVRSAAWWNLRQLLDPSDPTTKLALPDDEQLIAELTAPRWRVASGAKITVEPKDETKKRIRRSPDSADAVVMSLWYHGLDDGVAYIQDYGGDSDFAVSWR
jgi:hypothetical protein